VPVSTNWVRHFNIATFTNGVCVTNTNTGMAAYNPPPAPAGGGGNVMYGGPMMFNYYMGCTNILSDGQGNLLLQDGGQLYINNNDSMALGLSRVIFRTSGTAAR